MEESSFTPEQIQEILNIYFENFAHRQYIGQRYVPIFGRKGEESIEWDNTGIYEPLTIVLYQGNSYTSRQFVPIGVEITNQTYWANTGNYNAQVEAYRQEVLNLNNNILDEITARENADANLQTAISNETTARENADINLQTAIENADANLQTAISNETTARENADANLQTAISNETTARENADINLQELINSKFPINKNNINTNILLELEMPEEFNGVGVKHRIEYPNVYGAQGMEVFNIGSSEYVAIGFTNVNTDEYFIDIYNFNNGNKVSSSSIRSGHCNQIVFYDNKLFITLAGIVAENHTDIDIFTVNQNGIISFLENKNLSSIGFTYLSSFGRYKDNWFATTGEQFYLINNDLTARTYIGICPRYANDGIYQSLKYIPKYDAFMYTISQPNKLIFFDIDLNPIKTCQLKPAYSFVMVNELEDSSYYNGNWYFINNMPRRFITANYKVATLFIYKPGVDNFDMYDITLPTGYALFININKNSDGKNVLNWKVPYNRANAITFKYAFDLQSLAYLPFHVDIQLDSDIDNMIVLSGISADLRINAKNNVGARIKNSHVFVIFGNYNFADNLNWLNLHSSKPVCIYAEMGSEITCNAINNLTSVGNTYEVFYIERGEFKANSTVRTNAANKIYLSNSSTDDIISGSI